MDHFDYNQNVLHAEDVPIPTIAEAVGTPAYVYSSATLERHYRVYSEAFADIPHRICFAVKCNSNLAVLKTLANLGSGADVVSEGEIRIAQAAGVSPDNIVFSGIGKTRDEMAYALKAGIYQFNIESLPELEGLSDVAQLLGKTAPIAVRVNPDVDAQTHAKINTGHKASKFGIGIDHAAMVYDRAAQLPGISVQGVSVHIGSQLTSLAPFRAAYGRVADFVRELRTAGHTIRTLDLGGGLGVIYEAEEPPLPADYAGMVKEVTRGLNCELIFEPGRVIAGNAGILVTRVIYVKEEASRTYVILDAGMNDLARPALYGAGHRLVAVNINPGVVADSRSPLVGEYTNQARSAKMSGGGAISGTPTPPPNSLKGSSAPPPGRSSAAVFADIVGPVCETGDRFAVDYPLDRLPSPGELMAFRTAGAYGAVMSNTYNARPLVPEVMVSGSEYAVIRPRQTYEALLAQDTLPAWL